MLAEIQSVSTLPLDVSGSTETKSADLRVALPQDVRAEVERVRVTAVLEPRTVQRSLDNVELKVRNLGENLAVELDPKRVQVTISGLYPVVNPITPADLVAYVNLKDLAAGEYEISVTLNLPDDVRAVAIEPSMVKVSINNPEPEGEEDKPASSDNKP
jgi:YbbR domain-containing protein